MPDPIFEKAIEVARRNYVGADYPAIVNGNDFTSGNTFTKWSPVDKTRAIAHFPLCPPWIVDSAIEGAQKAFRPWSQMDWKDRERVLRHTADLIEENLAEFAAIDALEVGKIQAEAKGDAKRAADFIRYYCLQMVRNYGYVRGLEVPPDKIRYLTNLSVMKPRGVWVVISPFNFAAALSAGPIAAALLTGNTVVFKPASETPLTGHYLVNLFYEAGVPKEALHFVTGSAKEVGKALISNPKIAGLTFTGSYEVGMRIRQRMMAVERKFHLGPRPVVLEMGGKNAAIVGKSADLELAAEGIVRSAFGLSGQKCSACSRVFAEKSIYPELLELLKAKTSRLVVGDPNHPDTFLGPVINETAYQRYLARVEEIRNESEVVTGGAPLPNSQGWFVLPTVVGGLRLEHPAFWEELFVPLVCVAPVENLNDAIELANRTWYGLTGGFYSNDPKEIDRYLGAIEVGVAYVNRKEGATTGVVPGQQSFGGWKASGSTGFGSGGPHYLLSYLQEQSQTIYPPEEE